MNEYYAIDKETQKVVYQAASLFMLRNTIEYDKRDISEFIITEEMNMKYLSRIVYVDGECVYNNKDFWTKEAPTILEEFEEHEALDFMGRPVDRVRFETEFNSNSSRIANIDGVAGEVDYNMTVGNEFISLFREECIFTDFKEISPLAIGQKLINVITFVETGSFREAKMLLKTIEPDVFLTEERLKKYEDMLDAADAITYATPETFFYTAGEDPVEPEPVPEFTRVYTMTQSSNMTKEHTFYYAALHDKGDEKRLQDTDKLILVIRHAERDSSDTSGTGDINSTGVSRATSIGTKLKDGATPSSSESTNEVDIDTNDAHYFSTNVPRTMHTAQAIAAARGDTDSSASDYSGITIDQDLLDGYRFTVAHPDSGTTALLRKYSNDPSQLTAEELSTYFGVDSAEAALAKRQADAEQFTNEILAKADKRLNVFVTHDYFIGPFVAGITNGGLNTSSTDPWINWCSGAALVLHEDNTYDAFAIKCS